MKIESKRSLDQELERSVLEGLACEWQLGADGLPPAVAARLRRPTFRLSDMLSRWGYWNGQTRQIVISRKLVRKYPWDSVREILLHEMAHQVADEAFGASSQKAHGDMFQQACALLQANPAASGDCLTLEERIRSGAIAQRDVIMDRIDKLMALAQSSHRHEAEAAMLKAHELIAKHHVHHIKTGATRHFISAFVGEPALRHFQDDYEMANLLQDCYFVQGIWVRAFVRTKGKPGRVLEISGTPRNVGMARHVHAVLTRTIKKEWARYKTTRPVSVGARLDFALGLLQGFSQKINRQVDHLTADHDTRALIRVGDTQLESYFRLRYPRTRTFRRSARQKCASAQAAGRQIGRNLTIARAVESSEFRSHRRLPPGKPSGQR
jgi:hypothetical protein